jgi:hypothetical protein
MFLTSLVLLVFASSGLATTYDWTGTSPYSVLFVDPMNWDPLEPYGPDSCDDRARIGSTGANPTVVITAIEVDRIIGPAYEASADHEILLVQDANVYVCHSWRVEKTLPYKAYITLVDNAIVYIDGRFLSHDEDQSTVMSLSDNAYFKCKDDFRFGDNDLEDFDLTMTDNAYLYAGNDDDGMRQNNGEFHIDISGDAVLEVEYARWRNRNDPPTHSTLTMTENAQFIINDDHWEHSGGGADFTATLSDNATIIIDGDFRGGEDNDYEGNYLIDMTCGHSQLIDIGGDLRMIDDGDADGYGQINLHGGTIIVGDELRSDTDNWLIDICCNGTMILDGDVVDDIMDWHEDGHITVCGFGPCGGPADLAAEYDTIVAGKTVVWADEDPNAPYDPDPPCDQCEDPDAKVPVDQCLSWVSGENPCEGQGDLQHFVFISTNYDKVANAPADLSALVAILPEETTTYCPQLALGGCYYWRIVEVCPCHTTAGDIWCFCVEDCMVVEDMEGYDESCTANAVWEVWKDGAGDCNGQGGNGTGSTVYLATNPVHGGSQAMQYDYDSTGSERECFYSGATKTYDPPLNLVDNFEKAMVLYFYGQADNDTESMWVVLSDGTNSDQSTYGVYGDSPDDIKVEDWEIWAIDIADQFPSVDLSNLSSVEIGFGPRGDCDGDEDPGLPTGTVYFDDIELCTTICIPKYARDGDVNDDCCVDWDDLKVIADNWLVDRR